MAIRSSETFTYNNVSSETFGIINVNIDSGMLSEPLASSRNIIEESVRGNDKPYFMGVKREPFEFAVSFAFKDGWNDSKTLREVTSWLTEVDYYKPLQFSDNPDLIFYCIVVDEPELVHNCLSQGYINLHFRCADPYIYSPIYETQIYDYTTNPSGGTTLVFENYGDLICKPIIYAKVISGSTFSITNNSDRAKKIEFTGLSVGETITIDCENEFIDTDLSNAYRYNNMTEDSEFLPMQKGFNYLNVKGNIQLKFKYQFRLLQM